MQKAIFRKKWSGVSSLLCRGGTLVCLLLVCLLLANPVAALAQVVELKPGFRRGQTYRFSYRMKQNVIQTIDGQRNTDEYETGQTLRLDSVQTLQNGNLRLRLTFQAYYFYLKSPRVGTIEYASDQRETETQQQPHPAVLSFSALLGEQLYFTLDPSGYLLDVIGAETVADNAHMWIAEKYPELSGTLSRESFMRALEPAAVREFLQNALHIYPGRAVSPNDTWQNRQNLTAFGQEVRNSFTLISATADTLVLQKRAAIGVIPGGAAVQLSGGNYLEYDLKGAQSGSLYLAAKTGLPISGRMNLNARGNGILYATDKQDKIGIEVSGHYHFQLSAE